MPSWMRIYNTTSYALRRQAEQMARLQETAASGSRLLYASDHPGDAQRVMRLRTNGRQWAHYGKNLQTVTSNLEAASAALQQTTSLLTRVRQVTTQAANGTYGPEMRTAIAEELNSLLEQALTLANHQNVDQYVFAGASVLNRPYEATRENGRIVTVTYNGSRQEIAAPVAPGIEQAGVLVGDEVFRSNDRQAPELLGQTGASLGAGTASVRGAFWMYVEHTTTDYTNGAAAGIAAGTSSADDDTALGEHTITIDATAGTIRLDAGAAVNLTASADLALTNESGDVVHVDTTGWGGVWEGSFTITSGGTVRLGAGGDAQAIDYSKTNQGFEDAAGRLLYLNSTTFKRVGVEAVRVAGTYDLFGTLMHVRDVLQNEPGLPENDQSRLLDDAVGAVETVMTGITRSLTVVGGRLQGADRLQTTVENLRQNSEREVANLENADIADVAVELARTQTLYQATLGVAAKTLSLSLLDFLR